MQLMKKIDQVFLIILINKVIIFLTSRLQKLVLLCQFGVKTAP